MKISTHVGGTTPCWAPWILRFHAYGGPVLMLAPLHDVAIHVPVVTRSPPKWDHQDNGSNPQKPGMKNDRRLWIHPINSKVWMLSNKTRDWICKNVPTKSTQRDPCGFVCWFPWSKNGVWIVDQKSNWRVNVTVCLMRIQGELEDQLVQPGSEQGADTIDSFDPPIFRCLRRERYLWNSLMYLIITSGVVWAVSLSSLKCPTKLDNFLNLLQRKPVAFPDCASPKIGIPPTICHFHGETDDKPGICFPFLFRQTPISFCC